MTGESPPNRSEEEREAARLARERARAERAARRNDDAEPKPARGLFRKPRVTRSAADEPAPDTPPAEPPPAAEPPPDAPAPVSRPSVRERADALLSSRRGGGGGRSGRPGGSGSGFRRRRIVFLTGLALATVLVLWIAMSLFQPFTGDGEGTVAITIPRGSGVGDIADLLADRGVVSNGFLFELRVRLAGKRSDLKPGIYNLRRDMSYGAAIDALSEGPPKNLINVTFPEGFARREIAPRVKKAGVRGSYTQASERSSQLNPRRYGAKRARNLEGFLFPATYQLRRGTPARTLVDKQLVAFKREFAEVDLRPAKRVNLTAYDVLIIASLVEREAQLDRERRVIASVIYNRLKEGMTLGIDATIRYATGNWTRPLRQSELNSSSPYNTRLNRGLPPGPIGNPGIESIEAAARPTRTDYLFYVVKPGTCGEHAFSSTDAEFQRDVARYNEAREARGGRSPTNC